MTSAPPPRDAALTPADQALIAALAVYDVVATRHQLKELRTAGLIPSAQEPGSGRGRGRPSLAYPAGTVERVLEIHHIRNMGFRVPTRDLAMWLFLFSAPIDMDLVRESFRAEHARYFSTFPDDLDSAEMETLRSAGERRFSRSFLGKFLASATGERSRRPEGSRLGIVARGFMYLMGGESLTEGARRAVARAVFGADEDGGKALFQELRTLNPRRFGVKLDQLSDEQLESARDDLGRMIDLVFTVAGHKEQLRSREWIGRLRKHLHFDAHAAMIGVIQIALMKQSRYGNLSSRLVEVINEVNAPGGETDGAQDLDAKRLDS